MDYFLPGFRAGGPITSVRSLIEHLGAEYDFEVITRDRDLGATAPYPAGARLRDDERATVNYAPPGLAGLVSIRRRLRRRDYAVLYLNSLFSPPFTLWPLFLRRLARDEWPPVILAPRGELSPGSLSLKRLKKSTFLRLAPRLRLYANVIWQASSEEEAAHIQREFQPKEMPGLTPNIPAFARRSVARNEKATDSLRLLYLSRVAQNKNLSFVLDVLQGVEWPVQVTIAGPIEDKGYWGECERRIARLPEAVVVTVLGPVPPEETEALYASHDLFFLPTLGESYGHVIVEALAAGCPVLISDQTPWRNLEEHGVGWDLPLGRHEPFRSVLRTVYAMSQREHGVLSRRAREWSREAVGLDEAVQAQRDVIELALARAGHGGWVCGGRLGVADVG